MSFGETLRNAREQRNLTHSEVAENTHLKVQLIQDLEREEFKRIAAPIYGRSFVKIYAEFLNLDPVPLVREFMELYTGKIVTPPVKSKNMDRPSEAEEPGERSVAAAAAPGAVGGEKAPSAVHVAAKPIHRPAVREVETVEDDPILDALDPEAPLSAELPLEDFPVSSTDELPIFPNRDDDRSMPFFASGEPDLFNQSAHVSRDASDAASDFEEEGIPLRARVSALWRSCIDRLPRRAAYATNMEKTVRDDPAQQKRSARGQAFSDGVKRWGMGNGFSIQNFIPRKQTAWLFGAGAAILASCIVIGVVVVFRMAASVHTPGEAANRPSLQIERVSPIPDMYVD